MLRRELERFVGEGFGEFAFLFVELFGERASLAGAEDVAAVVSCDRPRPGFTRLSPAKRDC
jgi:hypothetical protein